MYIVTQSLRIYVFTVIEVLRDVLVMLYFVCLLYPYL